MRRDSPVGYSVFKDFHNLGRLSRPGQGSGMGDGESLRLPNRFERQRPPMRRTAVFDLPIMRISLN